MVYVYVLQSEPMPECHYVGITDDVLRRLEQHNSGKSTHTNKFKPWKVLVSVGFAEAEKAMAFEAYLKSGSGRAFAKKHF